MSATIRDPLATIEAQITAAYIALQGARHTANLHPSRETVRVEERTEARVNWLLEKLWGDMAPHQRAIADSRPIRDRRRR